MSEVFPPGCSQCCTAEVDSSCSESDHSVWIVLPLLISSQMSETILVIFLAALFVADVNLIGRRVSTRHPLTTPRHSSFHHCRLRLTLGPADRRSSAHFCHSILINTQELATIDVVYFIGLSRGCVWFVLIHYTALCHSVLFTFLSSTVS